MAFAEVAGGAVVGGAVSLATSWLLEIRRDRAVTVREETLMQREMVQSARLLHDELLHDKTTLEVLVESRTPEKVMPLPASAIPTDAWIERKSHFAAVATESQWDKVWLAYTSLWLITQARADDDEPDEEAKAGAELVAEAIEATKAALDVLRPLVKNAPG